MAHFSYARIPRRSPQDFLASSRPKRKPAPDWHEFAVRVLTCPFYGPEMAARMAIGFGLDPHRAAAMVQALVHPGTAAMN
jgi:hypothetical protein